MESETEKVTLKIHRLRGLLLKATSEEDFLEIWACVMVKAKDPNEREQLKAAELIFARTIGAPVELDLLERIGTLEELLVKATDSLTRARSVRMVR